MKPTTPAEAWAALESAREDLESALSAEMSARLRHTEASNVLERFRKVYDEKRLALLSLTPEAKDVRR